VVVEVVKQCDDDPAALVVRMYEAWGRRGPLTLRAPWAIGRATVTDLLEREVGEAPFRESTVTLDMAPFQIITVKLEPAGGRHPAS
jgi:alpha-mannosidase